MNEGKDLLKYTALILTGEKQQDELMIGGAAEAFEAPRVTWKDF